jgi:hypothetical protein
MPLATSPRWGYAWTVAGSSIVCFLVRDEPPRDTWRIAATMGPVMGFAKSMSKTSKVALYPAHTLYGDVALVQRLEAYLSNYAQPDGWYTPLSNETVGQIILRFKNEGAGFLATGPLP